MNDMSSLRERLATTERRGAPIRVMIVDDSATARAVFSRIIKREEDMVLAAVACTAEEGLEALRQTQVDVILLDLEMPGMGGLDALPRMIAAVPGVRIMVVSTLTVQGAEPTLAALSLGAADTLAKPQAGGFDDDYRERLIRKIRALGRTAIRAARLALAAQAVRTPVAPTRRAARHPAAVVAIGASTGGIHALGQLFNAMPRRIGMPILVTQHLPASFMDALARQLQAASGREALVATEGALLVPDRILIAPGDAHLMVVKRGTDLFVKLDRRSVPTGCLPAVDPMFASLAEALGGQVLGIVLSGMGRDGTEGARRIVEAGGTIFAQDEPSSAVWGMPGSVSRAGLATTILSPAELGGRIASAVTPA